MAKEMGWPVIQLRNEMNSLYVYMTLDISIKYYKTSMMNLCTLFELVFVFVEKDQNHSSTCYDKLVFTKSIDNNLHSNCSSLSKYMFKYLALTRATRNEFFSTF